MSDLHPVFVYGTLRKGESRHVVLEGNSHPGEKKAFIKDFDLVSLGEFPAIVPGERIVHGEIYYVNEDLLFDLDKVEGYTGNEKTSLYLRRKIQVFSVEQSLEVNSREPIEEAFVYVFNTSHPFGDLTLWEGETIENGDWISFHRGKMINSQSR